jgi:hypothetical protein
LSGRKRGRKRCQEPFPLPKGAEQVPEEEKVSGTFFRVAVLKRFLTPGMWVLLKRTPSGLPAVRMG